MSVEVYAIKYGERTGTRGLIFAGGDPHDAPLAMDYFLWAVRDGRRTVVIDVGYGRAEGEARGRTFLRGPDEALAYQAPNPVVIQAHGYSHRSANGG